MDVERIIEVLVDCLGDVDDDQQPLQGTAAVDVWETVLLRTDRVHKYELEMVELLKDWPSECEGHRIPALGKETSCAHVEYVLGNQLYAYLLFAFGKQLEWWDILDPRTELHLGKASHLARVLADAGLVTVTGYAPGGVEAFSQH